MRMFLCVLSVLALAASAQGVVFVEMYEDDIVNQPPQAPWDLIPGYGGAWVEDAGQHHGLYSLMINNVGFNGADRGSYALLDGGVVWNGSDDCKLTLRYDMYHGSSKQEKKCDAVVELALGDAHAPALPSDLDSQVPPAEAIPVLAYCKPWNDGDGDSKKLFYFDGKIWHQAGFTLPGWRTVQMVISTTTVDLDDGGSSGGNIAREYTGGFDTISIYTNNTTTVKKDQGWTSIDDVFVLGGYDTVEMPLDILPDEDPNYFVPNLKGNGRLPMVIPGSADVDVTQIDVGTISIEDEALPVKTPKVTDTDGDGYLDLQLHFSRRDVIMALGLDGEPVGEMVDVTVKGFLMGCRAFVATDVIIIAE